MTDTTTTTSAPVDGHSTEGASTYTWLLGDLIETTEGVHHAITVSSDGILVAASERLERAPAERLAAVVAGFTSLADGVSNGFGLGDVNQVVIEMSGGYLFCCAINVSASLAVLAESGANIGVIAYEMARFAARAGDVLSPEVIEVLKART